MRTTVDIPDPVYRRLKARAAREGRSAKELILRGVEEVLKADRRASNQKVTLPLVKSRRPGTLAIDNERIYDILLP
jgi:plasmid stability protein